MTIPEPVWDRAEDLAGLMGTTPNDVLALFAAKGMVLADRQLETAQIAADRVAAFRSESAGVQDVEMPPADDLDEAAKLLRRELDTPEE